MTNFSKLFETCPDATCPHSRTNQVKYIYIYVTVCVCVDGITLRAGGWSLKISLLEPVTDKLGQTRPKAG